MHYTFPLEGVHSVRIDVTRRVAAQTTHIRIGSCENGFAPTHKCAEEHAERSPANADRSMGEGNSA